MKKEQQNQILQRFFELTKLKRIQKKHIAQIIGKVTRFGLYKMNDLKGSELSSLVDSGLFTSSDILYILNIKDTFPRKDIIENFNIQLSSSEIDEILETDNSQLTMEDVSIIVLADQQRKITNLASSLHNHQVHDKPQTDSESSLP